MARRITVTFADGSSHVYENAPDDISPQDIVNRATREFSKPVKALDGGRGTIERAARAVGGAVSEAFDGVMGGNNAISGAAEAATPRPAPQALDRSGARGLGLADMGNTGRSLGLPAPVAKAANERGQTVADRINAPATIETDGYLDRQGVKIKQTMVGIGSDIVRAVAADTQDATSILPESFGDYLTQKADNADRYINAQVKGGTEFDDIMKAEGVLGKVGKAASFMAEEIPASLAYVPLLMSGLGTGAIVTSQAGNIGQDRADNNGTGPASSMDIAAAAPAAIASTALDKFGFDRMLGGVGKNVVSRIGNAAMGEGLTEGVQGIIEYAGGTIGTDKDFDVNEAGRQAASGALVGFGAGGAFRGVGEVVDAARGPEELRQIRNRSFDGETALEAIINSDPNGYDPFRTVGLGFDENGRIRARRAGDTRTPGPGIVEATQAGAANLSPEDLASPLDNADLAAGMAELAKPEAAGQADAALSEAGLPKVGSQVNVAGLPGGGTMSGTIEDVFSDDTGTGVVVRPTDGGKPMREYLDTLNELGVSITAFDPLAEADTIDATLAALASEPVGGSSPLPAAGAETPSPRPSGRTPSTGAGGVNFDMGRYMARTRGAESSGNDNAKAGTSSATGRYQFTDGTWLGTYREVFGNTGESEAQILAKRTDGAVQDKLMQRLTQSNVNALQKAGLPVNDGTAYLAHFAGVDRAKALLTADPNTPVADVLGAKAVAANPFLKGKTASQVVAWANKKMGGAGVGGMASDSGGVPDIPTQWAELPESAPIRSSEAPAPDLPEQSATGMSDEEWDSLTSGPTTIGAKPSDRHEPVFDESGNQTGWRDPVIAKQFQEEAQKKDAQRTEQRREEAQSAVDKRNSYRKRFTDWFNSASEGAEITDSAGSRWRVVEGVSKAFGKTKRLVAVDNDGNINNDFITGISVNERTASDPDWSRDTGFDPDNFGQQATTTGQDRAEALGRDMADTAGSAAGAVTPPEPVSNPDKLPAVAKGSVRLWRGNRPGEVGQNPQFTNDLEGIARPFQQGYGGPLSYVDVPSDVAEKALNRTGAAATGAEFILPPEWAARATIVDPGESNTPRPQQPRTEGAPQGWGSTDDAPAAPTASTPTPTARVEETSTGKSVAVIGASEAELAAIAKAVPKAKATPPRSDGAILYSKKYEAEIRAALASVAPAPVKEPRKLTDEEFRAATAHEPTQRLARHLDGMTMADLESVGRRLNQFRKEGESSTAFAYRIAESNSADKLNDAIGKTQNAARGEQGVSKAVTPKGSRQGEIGMQLAAGEVVRTTGGRDTTPFPKIAMDTDRKAGNTLRNVDKWLAENALAEAEARGDDFNAPMFRRMVENPRNISQSDKDSAEQYLFGEQPPVLPPLGRPMDAAPARPAPKSERPLSERDPRAYREEQSKDLPDGYSLSDTSSGLILKGPGGGMVGGYLAPSGTSGETLERAVKAAKQAAAKDVERRAKMGAKQPDRSAAIIMDPAAGTVKTVPLGRPEKTAWRNPESFIRIAADDVSALRKADVERVIREAPSESREMLGDYIAEKRPDLAEEVRDVQQELAAPVAPQRTQAELSRASWQEDFDAAGRRMRDRLDAVDPENLRPMLEAMAERDMRMPDGDLIENLNPHRAVELGYVEIVVDDRLNRYGQITQAGRDFVSGGAAAAPATAPATPTKYAKNTIVSEDKIAAARKRMAERMGRLNAGFDPEMALDGMIIAAGEIEAGVRNFAEFAKNMRDAFGKNITPYLLSFWESARAYPGLPTDGMTDATTSKAMHEMMLAGLDETGAVTDATNAGTENVDAQLSNRLPASNAGTSASDVQGTSQDGRNGSSPEQEGRGGSETVSGANGRSADAAERSAQERSGGANGKRAGVRDTDSVPATRDAGRVAGQDWAIAPGSLAEDRSPAQKARDNVEAIALVKQIEREGRPATREEQEQIARYVGWGGLANIFPDTATGQFGKGFETLGPRLRELLTDEEYETASRSIQYAHYTGETVVRGMWDIARQLGFTGGAVFEPGMGTGNFRGMMPADIAAASSYSGIEYDHLTASIAKLLYPQSGVRQADYTTMPGIKGAVDLVIGNPPFSATVISSDPEYGPQKFVLHDFFFAKSLDALKPGGLLMFVTSAGTMNKVNDKARAWLAERADLVGAVRLPGNTFEKNAGTSVTTDIVILRKRIAGEAVGDRSWVETDVIDMLDRNGGKSSGAVNRYFLQNPDMVLGEQGMFDQLVAGPRYAVRAPAGFDLAAALTKAAEKLPANIMSTVPNDKASDLPDVDFGSAERKDGSYYLADGKLMQYRGGVGRPVQSIGKGVKGGMSAAGQERVRGLVPIRDALREVYAADLRDDGAKGQIAREKLNAAYDAFVAKFGPINKTDVTYRRPSRVEIEGMRAEAREEARLAGNEWDDGSFDVTQMLADGAKLSEIAAAREAARDAAIAAGRTWNEGSFDPADVPDKAIEKRPNLDPFLEDEEGYRLAAIEHYKAETGEASKGRAFYENAVRLDSAPKINSADDALLYSLNKLGRPDIRLISDMAGKSQAEILEELGNRLFEVPGKPGVYETAETYLSGNVREKLALARAEAARNAIYDRNVKALEAAMPEPLTPSEIAANLGMPWIPPKVIEAFATDRLGLQSAKVSYQPKLAQWTAAGDTYSAAARNTWGTERMDAMSIMEAALNRQTPQIRDRQQDGSSVLNTVATQAVQDKMAEIKAAFREWVWNDDTRSTDLTKLYNENYNSLVAPKYDGSYLTTPGIAADWNWRPHQRAVIARIVQSGNTYMAHEVGAGKTSAMIGAGMEMKRLGLVSKPMYVVPNHMLMQFTKEFYEQYPLARIRVADEQRFHKERRKEFVARMAADDLDAVIITHSAFGYIPMSDEFMENMISQEIDNLDEIISEIGKDQDQRVTRKKAQQQKEALEQRLLGMKNKKADKVFTFEETGVDFMFVDEAHLFRKLNFTTKMANVKGIDPSGSAMSFDLFAKTRHLEAMKPGRNLVLASGTPITNTMAELYSLSRYLQQNELEKRGLSHFDAWAGAFGDTVTALEQDAAGGYKAQTRFAQFVNVPELSVMVRQVMDVVGAAELRQYVTLPTLAGGERQMVLADQTESQSNYQDVLRSRMEAIKNRSGPPQKGDDIVLSVIGDGRKSAIDYRLIDASAPREEGSKLERMIDNVARLHKEYTRSPLHTSIGDGKGYSAKPVSTGPATQMIFSDFGINGAFPVHKYIRQSLIARGVPASQIAIISDYKTSVAKQRLFNDMNEGKVRVLIGSVAKMGTGVNAQKRLRAIHNMDAQWYPANDTQRNGRGIRQGNMNPEVGIFDYATQGTYDSTMWAMMARKGRFIEGFMRGDPTMRDMEDLGEASAYEQAAALTTSDPRMMDLTEWKQDLEKLDRRRIAFQRGQQSIRARIAYAEQDQRSASALIPLIEQDIAKRVLPEGEEFTGKVAGQTFDDRAEFGAALIAAMDGVTGRAKGRELRENVGELAGLPIVGESRIGPDGPMSLFHIKRAGNRETTVKIGEDARGLTTRMVNALRKFDDELKAAQRGVASAEREIADYAPQLNQAFDDGGKREELRAKITALEATLDAETKAAEAAAQARAAQAQEPQQSIPESNDLPTVTVNESDWGKLPKPGKARLDILRARVARWYDGLIGTTITASDGREVKFNHTGEKKTLRAGEDLLMIAKAIPKIIQSGKLIGTEPSKRPGMRAVHRYAANVRGVDGNTQSVMVFVRETGDGSFQYSLNHVVENARDTSAEADREAKKAFAPALEGGARDSLNLVAFDAGDKSVSSTDAAQLENNLQERLESYGIARKVALRIVDTLGGAAGEYRSALMKIATDTTQAETFTLDHEVIHALREMGMFNNSEWAILSAKARRDPGLMRSIRQRYEAGFRKRGMSGAALEEALIEEAVSDLFARYQRGDYKAEGTIARVFKALRQAIEAIANYVQQRGARTAEGVMSDVASGQVGTRETDILEDPKSPRTEVDSERFAIPERDDLVALGGTEPTWKGKGAEAFDKWRTAMQDRYLPLLKVQRQIEEQTGKSLPVSRNPYMGEELMTGRIGARLEKLAEENVQPLFDAMHADKVSTEELESFLYARHAPERNARIAEINPEFTEGEGSGMTDLEAAAIMSRIRKAGKMEAMERLAARVDQIRDDALEYRVQTGLISKADVEEWKSTYQFYVPLRGFKETGTDAIPERMNRSGGGINVRGRESKQAFGRRSQADSPLAYLILQAEEAIVRGETNIVAARFYNLAKANPDDAFWKINKASEKKRINEESGLVESYLSYNLAAEDADWTVSAKINGKQVRVTMSKQNVDARRLADAMRNLTQHQMDWVTLHMGKVNRFLSVVNTSYNPEFIITNAFRDIQTAAFNLSGEQKKGLVKGTLKDYRSALAVSMKGAFGKHSGEWGKWYDEFTMNGGRVYFNKVENVEEIKGRIAKAAEMAQAKAGEGGTRLQAKRMFLAARDFIENTNNGVENAVRLAVYKNAREAGLTPTQSASMAKNVTVNFNRRGTAGPAMNAAYLFFNASVQGSTRIIMALRSPRVRKMVAGMMITAAAVEMLNAMMSADDDDGESIYDKIPAFDKSRNIVLMMPDGKSYIKIPMPYGYNAFWEAGRSAAEIGRRGGGRWKETMGQFVGTVAGAFNPIGGSGSLLNMLSPTITDPIVDLTLNKDFTDKPIMPNQSPYGPEEPDNQRYFNSIGPHWRAITDFFNTASGGDEVMPGAIDVSPETLEYLAGTVVGSAGGFLDRIATLVGKGFDEGEEVTANDIPLARKVIGSKPAWVDKAAYYDRVNRVEQEMSYVEDYLDAGSGDEARTYAEKNRNILTLEGAAKQAKKDMRDVRKARREIVTAKERKQIDDATYRQKKEVIDRADKMVVTEFNTAWVQAMQTEE